MHPYLVYELKNIGYLPPARMQVAFSDTGSSGNAGNRPDLLPDCHNGARLRSRYGYHGETVITKNALRVSATGPSSKLPANLPDMRASTSCFT